MKFTRTCMHQRFKINERLIAYRYKLQNIIAEHNRQIHFKPFIKRGKTIFRRTILQKLNNALVEYY
ncbi:hypothetical protein PUN28_018772 [Cardiocondyla obscurior]|uniref:Uncharacterized protein n=1 Tax=Cardiocondyla obscurior TaxID=286306 RepID=A0AAW2EFN7_9HYME